MQRDHREQSFDDPLFYMDRIILDHWTASEGQSFLIGVPFQAFTVMRLKGISIQYGTFYPG